MYFKRIYSTENSTLVYNLHVVVIFSHILAATSCRSTLQLDTIVWFCTPNNLTIPHVLREVEIKPFGVALLARSDAAKTKEQIKNIAHCPLPIMYHNTYPERFY